MSEYNAFEKINKVTEKIREENIAFIKHILLMSSGLLGVLVALHKETSQYKLTAICFSVSILLLAAGILFLSIALYQQIALYKSIFPKVKEESLKQIQDTNYKPKVVTGNISKIYEISEKTGYISCVLSLIFLALYAIRIA